MSSAGKIGTGWLPSIGFKPLAYFPAWGTGLVLLLVLTEPSRATGLSLLERVLFHAVHVFLPLGGALSAARALMASRSAALFPYWWGLAVIGALAAAISVPAFVALEIWLAPIDLDGEPPPVVRSLGDWFRLWPAEALESGRIIVPIWLAMNLGARWLQPVDSREKAQPAAMPNERSGATEGATAPKARSFLDLLPARLGREVRCLRAEQHYVRVVTARGDALLLYAFGAAAREAADAGIAGSMIHRSVWVSFASVAGFERSAGGGEGTCLLDDGTRLPVSRRRWTTARAEFEAFAPAKQALSGPAASPPQAP